MSRSSFRRALRPIGCLAIGLMISLPCRAIEITFTIDNPQNNPGYDPDGSKLASIAQAAASIWMSLRPGNETYHWNIHWEDFEDGSALAVANDFDGSIKFKTNAMWFIDPTPLVNEEFAEFQPLYVGSLDSTTKNLWFAGSNPPNELEYGYTGTATSGAAVGAADLLTFMLHEMGHLSGISYNALSPDVPIPAQWVGHRNGVKVRRENESHIMPDEALMDPFMTTGVRALPSALDVLVNAHEKGAASVHLDRVDFSRNVLAPSDNHWSSAFNWIGGQTPDLTQHARIGFGNEVVAALPATAKSLELSGDSELVVHGNLDIAMGAIIREASEVTIGQSSLTRMGSALTLADPDSRLTLQGGTLEVGEMIANSGTMLRGHGTLTVHDRLDNMGSIRAEGGTLFVQANPTAEVDLGGSDQTGRIEAITGDLVFSTGYFDPFWGTLRIAAGQAVQFTDGFWLFNFGHQSKTYFMSGSNGNAPAVFKSDLLSDILTMQGAVDVAAGVHAVIDVSNIDIHAAEFEIAAGGTLDLRGSMQWNSSKSYYSPGDLILNGPVAINASVGMTFGRVDLDGKQNNNQLTINENKKLTLVASYINDDNRFYGSLHLGEKAELQMTIDSPAPSHWANAGQFDLYDQSSIKGSLLKNEGLINVNKGAANIYSDFIHGVGSVVHLDGNTESMVTLDMHGEKLTYAGGVVTAPGALPLHTIYQTYGQSSVTGDSTVIAGYFNWDASSATDSSTRIAPQTTFTIRTGRIGTPDNPGKPGLEGFGDTIDLDSGHLDVLVGADAYPIDLPSYWSITEKGRLNLNWVHHTRPSVQGSLLRNHGTISGHGTFHNRLENYGDLVIGHDSDIGSIDLLNEFRQYETGGLFIQLGGLNPGSQHDQLRSTSVVFLDGLLQVDLFAGFTPQGGDWFRLVDATLDGKVIGQFSQLHLPQLEGDWQLIYGDTYVDLRYNVVPEPSSMILLLMALTASHLRGRSMSSRRANQPLSCPLKSAST